MCCTYVKIHVCSIKPAKTANMDMYDITYVACDTMHGFGYLYIMWLML